MTRYDSSPLTNTSGLPWEFGTTTPSGPFEIVVVCRANVARSPLIERMLQSELNGLQPRGFRVRSAGTRAVPGQPMAAGSEYILRSRGIDPSGFTSVLLTAESLKSADLVITAEQAHASHVVDLRPSLMMKTFTLLELADIVTSHSIETQDVFGFVRRVSSLRSSAGVHGGELDLADPVGNGPVAFPALERQLGDSIGLVARALVGAS